MSTAQGIRADPFSESPIRPEVVLTIVNLTKQKEMRWRSVPMLVVLPAGQQARIVHHAIYGADLKEEFEAHQVIRLHGIADLPDLIEKRRRQRCTQRAFGALGVQAAYEEFRREAGQVRKDRNPGVGETVALIACICRMTKWRIC
jgi:hypothetical protein